MLVKDIYKCTWYGEEITETQYNEILSMLRNRPTAPDGFAYRLTKELEWELYEAPVEEEPELTADEALNIILGGEV
jgi:hypothetical protein